MINTDFSVEIDIPAQRCDPPGDPVPMDRLVRALRRVAARQVHAEYAERDRVYADNLRLESENADLRAQLEQAETALQESRPKFSPIPFGSLPTPPSTAAPSQGQQQT